uniref:Uncharacterized protein n=1 Tax=Callorhinchus milii TaxID=7868 RepID=A0A4W3J7Y5_CALMI
MGVWEEDPRAGAQEVAVHTQEVAVHTQEVAVHTQEVNVPTQEVAAHTQEVAAHTQEVAAHTQEVAGEATSGENLLLPHTSGTVTEARAQGAQPRPWPPIQQLGGSVCGRCLA